MSKLKVLVMAMVCLTLHRQVDSTQQVIDDMSKNFRKALHECKKEMDLPDTIDEDFDKFWKEDHPLVSRHTGCAIMCLSTKLEIVDPDLNLHHGNANEFAKKHGADEELAKLLVGIIRDCGDEVENIPDNCMKVLEWAKCYKTEIHKRDLAPPVEVIIGEVLAEV